MTAARALALAALVAAGVLVAVVLLGGEKMTPYKLRFQSAGQLVKDNDVQIGGRRIGRVTDIRLTDNNQAEIGIEVSEKFAPLREGTTAQIRQTSLSGIANRYIQLTAGPNNADELEDNALLGTEKTGEAVDLDQLFNTLDPKARRSLQRVIQGSAEQFKGKGEQANAAAEYFNPALSTTRELVNELTRDQRTLERFIVDGAKAMGALAEKRDTLTDLVSNANEAAQGIAAENDAFGQSLRQLPQTLRRANTTFVNLRATLGDLDELVAESKPATKDLEPFLRELRPLVRASRPTIKDLRLAIRAPGPNNDLTELTRKMPGVARAAEPSLRNTTTTLRKLTPVLDFIRPYSSDLVGWFRDFGQGTANYDANGHFARIQPIYNTFSFTDNAAGGTLTPQDPDDRLRGYQTGVFKRCPGGGTQPARDGSTPYKEDATFDCDERQVPPGP